MALIVLAAAGLLGLIAAALIRPDTATGGRRGALRHAGAARIGGVDPSGRSGAYRDTEPVELPVVNT